MWLRRLKTISLEDHNKSFPKKLKKKKKVPRDKSLKIASGVQFILNKDADVDAEIDTCDMWWFLFAVILLIMKDNPEKNRRQGRN